MRLPVESWLNEQRFNSEAKDLFQESIICYKASAYRGALLLSFLAFQLIIKDRVLKADKPDNIHLMAWETIKKNLRKEEVWDTEVLECIKKNDENKRVFIISDDIRQQAIYWKYRRNDCAHSKSNIIGSSHVESFWLFLVSNLPKFVVNGSLESIVLKIEKHFNPNYTKDGEDFSYIIREIPNAINVSDFEEFCRKIDTVFEEYELMYPIIADKAMSFWNELIRLGEWISSSTISYIKHNTNLEVSFLHYYPEHVASFYIDDPSGIRNLWREKSEDLSILASLLRNGMLEHEKEEALEHMVRNVWSSVPMGDDISTLNENGYFQKYKELVFNQENPLISEFTWGNKIINIGNHIDIIGLEVEVVLCINNTFEHRPYPFKLQSILSKYFAKSKTKRDEYLLHCESLGITPTQNLGFGV